MFPMIRNFKLKKPVSFEAHCGFPEVFDEYETTDII